MDAYPMMAIRITWIALFPKGSTNKIILCFVLKSGDNYKPHPIHCTSQDDTTSVYLR
ncbi:hypothetical protein BDQ17DRAFT_1434942 [Cyathus striatus]|nr:hypothetical protein BDQ17DRAFT_1434942 [Cyathus striatus]